MANAWSSRWERLRTVPGLGRDTAALVVMVTLGVIAALLIRSNLSGGGMPWTHHTTVQVEFASVPGVNVESSAIVTMAGVKVGRIAGWKATDHDSAVLKLQLNGDYKIYDNAHAVLRPKNPLNEMSVELNPGTPAAKQISADHVIPESQTERPVQPDEVLDHLDPASQQALTDLLLQSDTALARSATTLPSGLNATTQTLNTLKPVMDKLSQRHELISQLVTSLSQIATAVGKNDDRLGTLATATQQTLGALADNDGNLQASLNRLPGLTTQLKSALSSTQTLTKQLNPTLDDLHKASKTLPGALKDFQSTVGNLDDTLVAARPVLAKAKPVVADLRPMVDDTAVSLDSLHDVTSQLDHDTATVMSYLTDIKAFVYNTSSVFGAGDAQGSIIRGHLVVPLPGGGVIPNQPVKRGGN